MKTARQWMASGSRCGSDGEIFLIDEIREVQTDAQNSARAEVLAELKSHWGHDIVRGIAWKLCDRWGWDKPLATPSAVHPSPAAPGSAGPAAAASVAPALQSPAPPSLPLMGCLPPGSQVEVTNSIRAEQSAPPTAQAPDYETARLWANRLNAEWFERLGQLEARIAKLEQFLQDDLRRARAALGLPPE